MEIEDINSWETCVQAVREHCMEHAEKYYSESERREFARTWLEPELRKVLLSKYWRTEIDRGIAEGVLDMKDGEEWETRFYVLVCKTRDDFDYRNLTTQQVMAGLEARVQ